MYISNDIINNNNLLNTFRTLFVLCKVKVTIAVSLTTLAGYILATGQITFDAFIIIAGIFLLASGASVINQIQEIRQDKIMLRTASRPLPMKEITLSLAWSLSIILVVAGLIILYCTTEVKGLILGIISIVWYNIFYTYLKRITAFAIIPGAFIGAIPPLIGWLGGGRLVFSSEIIAFSSFIVLWQIPHFWILLLIYGKEYELAGFPSLTNFLSNTQIMRMTFLWILLTVVSIMILPFYCLGISFKIYIILCFLSLILLCKCFKLIYKKENNFSFKQIFWYLNIYALLVIILTSIDYIYLDKIYLYTYSG